MDATISVTHTPPPPPQKKKKKKKEKKKSSEPGINKLQMANKRMHRPALHMETASPYQTIVGTEPTQGLMAYCVSKNKVQLLTFWQIFKSQNIFSQLEYILGHLSKPKYKIMKLIFYQVAVSAKWNGKCSRPWSVCSLGAVWSGSALFAQNTSFSISRGINVKNENLQDWCLCMTKVSMSSRISGIHTGA